MDSLKRSVICKICNNILKDPVFLPCHNTVCQYHVEVMLKHGTDPNFECSICGKTHEKNLNDLKENELASSIIKSNVYLNEQEKLIKIDLEKNSLELDYLFKTQDKLEVELDLFTGEYFFDVKSKINLNRKELKSQIDMIADKMIYLADEYESKYKLKLADIKKEKTVMSQDDFIKLKMKLNSELLNPILQVDNIIRLKREINEKTSELKDKINEYEMIKKNIYDCKFEPKKVTLNEEFFGEMSLIFDYKLVSGSMDNTIKIWDIKSGSCIKTLKGHTGFVYSLSILSTDKIVSCAGDNTIKVWDIRSGSCIKTVPNSSYCYCLKVLSPNEVVSGSDFGLIKIWDLTSCSCKKILVGHFQWVIYLDLLPNGELVSSSLDKTIKIWDVQTGICISTLNEHKNAVTCLKPLPENNLASGSADKSIKIWDLCEPKCIQTLYGHVKWIRCLEYTIRNELISCSDDKSIRIWDLKAYVCLRTIYGHDSSVVCIRILTSNKLISGASDGTIKIWDLKYYECLRTLREHKHSINCIQLFPS